MTSSHQYVGWLSRGGCAGPGGGATLDCSCVSSASGSEMSGGVATGCCMPVNCGGRTPTIVTGTLLTRTFLPMTFGSVPKRECQYFELMTATGGAVGESSSGRIVRPMRAVIPRT